MLNKDQWLSCDRAKKKQVMEEVLTELYQIDHNKHVLSNQPKQGSLISKKKELEAFIINVADWDKQ